MPWEKPNPLPWITLIKLIYTDKNNSIKGIFKFVNPCYRCSSIMIDGFQGLKPTSVRPLLA